MKDQEQKKQFQNLKKNKMSGLGYPDGCGWFCRRLHDVSDVVAFVSPSVHTRLKSLLSAFDIDIDNFAFRTIALSAQDELILDDWYVYQFEPWTKKILESFNLISTRKTSSEKVNIINDLHSQICLVIVYHQLLVIPELSEQGKIEMNRLIEEFTNALSAELSSELSNLKTIENAVSIPFKTIDPIITGPIKGFSNYKCMQYSLTRVDVIDNDIVSPGDITQDVIDESGTTPVTETPKPKKSNIGGLIAGAVFGSLVLLAVANDDDKEKKKKNQK